MIRIIHISDLHYSKDNSGQFNTRYKDYNIAAMRDYRNMKIFRFEVYNDTSKKIKRVYVREVK